MINSDNYDNINNIKQYLNMDEKTDLDKPVYRIFSRKRFLELLQTKKNSLVRPRIWEDPYENFFLRAKGQYKGREVCLKNIADLWYCQCWSLNGESDAMWRIYSPNKDGVMIKTTIRKLFDSLNKEEDNKANLNKYFIGRVKYKTEDGIKKFINDTSFESVAFGGRDSEFAKILLIKRESFKHEEEVRLLYSDPATRPLTYPRAGNVCEYCFDLNTICDQVILDPRLNDKDFTELKDLIESEGCDREIMKSRIYETPCFTIPLQDSP